MSISSTDGPGDMPTVRLTENLHGRLRGDMGTDRKAIDLSIGASTSNLEESFRGDQLFEALDSFDTNLLAMITKVGFFIEYGSEGGEWIGLRVYQGDVSIDIARTDGDAQVVDEDSAFEYYAGAAEFSGGAGIVSESADLSAAQGGEGFTRPDWLTPDQYDNFVFLLDDDDELTVYLNHDQNTASIGAAARIFMDYHLVEPIATEQSVIDLDTM